ncbi:hypothetical protein HDV03_003340 [Kappamyces sp. JEL0829]|nr:hypothetical protein HDV03_003340 [Kappamyces sp. JEL0829]
MKSFLLAAFVALAAAAPQYTPKPKCPAPPPTPAPSYPKKFTILHTNDIHSHMEEFNSGGTSCSASQIAANTCFGGVARIKTVVDAYRANTTDLLLMDAGDQFQGTLFFNFYNGSVSSLAMNALKYDVMTIGNHEFDKGIKELAKFVKSLSFPVVSSNINVNDAYTKPLADAGVKPYHIIEKYNLAVIGYITKDTPSLVANGEQLASDILDPVVTVQKYVDELHAKGIKRIICLSHNGYAEDQLLAKNVRGVGLIVGGHSHSLLLNNATAPNGVRDPILGPYPTKVQSALDGKPVWVVQAHRFGDYLGHIELEWDDQDSLVSVKGDPILLDQTIPKNAALNATIVGYEKIFETLSNDILTTSTAAYGGQCGETECSMGAILTDCMISEQSSLAKPIDVAFLNSGGIRATFPSGKVSAADVLTVLPFGNAVANWEWTGAQLLAQLERVATGNDAATKMGSWPQWSGIAFSYDTSKPVGSRVTSAKVNGVAVDKSKIYQMSSIDFIMTGGDKILYAPVTPTPPASGTTVDF